MSPAIHAAAAVSAPFCETAWSPLFARYALTSATMSLWAVAPWALRSTCVTAAADDEEPMVMMAAANVKISARRSISTPLGVTVRQQRPYGLITRPPPACQCLHPESSANGAARQAPGSAVAPRQGLMGAIQNGRGLACPLRLEGRSVEEPNRESADRDDAEKEQGG